MTCQLDCVYGKKILCMCHLYLLKCYVPNLSKQQWAVQERILNMIPISLDLLV